MQDDVSYIAKNKKKVLLIIILVISLAASALGVLFSLNHIHYNVEKNLEFIITSEEDFYTFIEYYNQYDVVKLDNNIEIKNEFESIGTKNNQYKKVFDGQGYTITLSNEAKNIPLFGVIAQGATVKNLVLKDVKFINIKTNLYLY